MKTPSSKHQTPGKPQALSINGSAGGQVLAYPEIDSASWVLKEGCEPPTAARHPFDLQERTARFGEAVVRFCRRIPRGPSNDRLIDQLVGCSTSVGANYLEASESVSRKDFRFSISRCVKEAKETKYFLRMVAASEPKLVAEARSLYREAHELHLIFATIFRKGQNGSPKS